MLYIPVSLSEPELNFALTLPKESFHSPNTPSWHGA
jgi:hypothetical protein